MASVSRTSLEQETGKLQNSISVNGSSGKKTASSKSMEPAPPKGTFIGAILEVVPTNCWAEARDLAVSLDETLRQGGSNRDFLSVHRLCSQLVKISGGDPTILCKSLAKVFKKDSSHSWFCRKIRALELVLKYDQFLVIGDIEKLTSLSRIPPEELAVVAETKSFRGLNVLECSRTDLNRARRSETIQLPVESRLIKQINSLCEKLANVTDLHPDAKDAIQSIQEILKHDALMKCAAR